MKKIEIKKLPNLKWKVDFNKAKNHHINGLKVVGIGSNNTILVVDLNKIPMGMTVLDFIEYIQEKGIAFIDSSQEG